MIRVHDLQKSFGGEHVLRGASLELFAGRCIGLVGESGSGKSTLARCLVGLESIDGGTVEVDGITIQATCPVFDHRWVAVRRRIALVFQSRVLPPYRRLLDQIIEGPRFVFGMPRCEAIAHCMPWINRLGLKEQLGKWPSQVSGGQLARAYLARAVVMNPAFLICDELTANLDERLAMDILDTLLALVSSGTGLLLITHQHHLLRARASAILQLHNGRITQLE